MFLILLALSCITFSIHSVEIGTPLTKHAKKVMLLGAGELAKEIVIELQRFGVEVIAVDRYAHAPAMHVAHRSYVIQMTDGTALNALVEKEQPDYIVPEIEAIATDTLLTLESKGYTVIPNARATNITMDREGIRRLAAEELKLKTSAYRFVSNEKEYQKAVDALGVPCVVKPVMSSSGKGQSVVRTKKNALDAWHYAHTHGRTQKETVIVEEFVDFDYEITLLTIRTKQGTQFCAPIGHKQIDGDYRESWQPHPMNKEVLEKAQDIAKKITDALGGVGVFGVELFIKGNEVYFSEVSPRPHDTGMVTFISQNLSECELHVRALLGLPIPAINLYGPSASCVLLVNGVSDNVRFARLDVALQEPDTQLRLFGKPKVTSQRRMGVALARGNSIEHARSKARNCIDAIEVIL